MATRAPMLRCELCGIVPPSPYLNSETGDWGITCPCCDRTVWSDTEDGVREAWAELNGKPPQTQAEQDKVLALLDSIEAAMCDVEGIRRIPGAMDAWHRWMDAYRELRACILEAKKEADE